MAPLILVIEDEPDLVEMLEYNLQREGLDTRSAGSGGEGLALARREPVPDLVLLDLTLPDISGTEVCRRLRRAGAATANVPVVMLTARGDEVDRVVGFEVGADDYVVKPFSVRELILRIRAVLRRSAGPGERPGVEGADGADGAEPGRTTFGTLAVDEAAHEVLVEGAAVPLTALEFRLLVHFLSRRGRVQSRGMLLSDVWGIDADVDTRTVDTNVKRLREKLGVAGGYIETIRGVGYRFRRSADPSG